MKRALLPALTPLLLLLAACDTMGPNDAKYVYANDKNTFVALNIDGKDQTPLSVGETRSFNLSKLTPHRITTTYGFYTMLWNSAGCQYEGWEPKEPGPAFTIEWNPEAGSGGSGEGWSKTP